MRNSYSTVNSVHFRIFRSQERFLRPSLLFPSTLPCMMVCKSLYLGPRNICPKYSNFLLLTVASNSRSLCHLCVRLPRWSYVPKHNISNASPPSKLFHNLQVLATRCGVHLLDNGVATFFTPNFVIQTGNTQRPKYAGGPSHYFVAPAAAYLFCT